MVIGGIRFFLFTSAQHVGQKAAMDRPFSVSNRSSAVGERATDRPQAAGDTQQKASSK